MKKHNKQIITIDSQSDIDSSSSNQPMEIQQNSTQTILKNKQSQQDMYRKFSSSNYYLLTGSLIKYANQFSDFLQDIKKNVLFVFGPSGCGKSTLISKVLQHNRIITEKLDEYEDEQGRIVSLGDVILKSLTKIDSKHVHISFDFPITIQKWNMNQIREFKSKFSQQIKKTMTKTIFVLNEQIYNSFYVLNERANSDQNLNNRDNVSVIKIQKFGIFEMKKLLKGFYQYEKLYNYVGLNKDLLDQIVELSNGDLRKALNMLYWRGIEDKSIKILKEQKKKFKNYQNEKKLNFQQNYQNKNIKTQQNTIQIDQDDDYLPKYSSSKISNTINTDYDSNSLSLFSTLTVNKKIKPKRQPVKRYDEFMKYKTSDQSRCSLYHGLGKLLYGKRLNVKFPPKNKKQISCYYTEQQINQLDPPFYFDPVTLFEQLRIDFDIVAKLLQENYLQRYGKTKDVKNMSNIFRMHDSFFSFKNNIEDEQVKQIKVKLITWGILVYNKNSRTDNMGFKKIQKSESTNVDKKVRQKKRLLRLYFPQGKLWDLIRLAHFTRATTPNSLLNETMFNRAISRQNVIKLDDHTKTLNEQQQQHNEISQKLKTNEIENKLRDNMRNNERKRRQMLQMLEELDEEDVDQISDSD